ncbi:hypothetical protein CIL05_08480 [Virgibacillus profundi]|uniref:DUF3397 domain-containing protein n=1 Tax=Virgibacillus profundi TaxID=2024555 RepID=A0A2A2IFJ4_9BACI|nr:hypothetical protein CIL05_08480 [Virgibacillus profundi]PXY54077.1 DUF3397 domain-containing protein [Virgibacillus profundi]
MIDFIIYLIAFFITVPIFATWLLYKIIRKFKHGKLRAFHQAVNWTTILYIIAVTILLTIIFEKQFIGITLVFLLSILTVIIIFQWKMNTEILFKKAIKVFWRFSFLIFFVIYICLLLIGVIRQIFFY